MMLRHGLSPDGMLHGTMVPIPKGMWANLSSSDNFRAITLCSILCKLLDVIVMTKTKDNLCTSNLQFSFKPGASTTLYTGMVQDNISYYVNNESHVYGLLLDASKAFDHVNYCKLFRTLLDRNISHLYICILIKSYGLGGKQLILHILMLLMVSNRGKLFLQFCFVFTWMIY